NARRGWRVRKGNYASKFCVVSCIDAVPRCRVGYQGLLWACATYQCRLCLGMGGVLCRVGYLEVLSRRTDGVVCSMVAVPTLFKRQRCSQSAHATRCADVIAGELHLLHAELVCAARASHDLC